MILKQFSFAELEVQEPDEDLIKQAEKESNKSAADDSFKKKYERMQELLKKMNQKFADKEISLEAYKHLFKQFSDAVPVAWLYTFYTKELDRYWRDGGNFDKEEFLANDKCKGISELQGCLSCPSS